MGSDRGSCTAGWPQTAVSILAKESPGTTPCAGAPNTESTGSSLRCHEHIAGWPPIEGPAVTHRAALVRFGLCRLRSYESAKIVGAMKPKHPPGPPMTLGNKCADEPG
jgi:hypothetical protein